jgi:hypothetical protein
MYSYHDAVWEDVEEYLKQNNIELTEENYDEVFENMFMDDSITGNASGSYTFNAYQAEENLAHNWDLLLEVLKAYDETSINILEKGPEWCDVTIRCYLLNQILMNFL